MLLADSRGIDGEQVARMSQVARNEITGSTDVSRPVINPRAPKTTCNCRKITRTPKNSATPILAALENNPLFMSAALPLKVFPPLFNRYQNGQSFGNHVDNAIRQVTGTPHRVRTDLSARCSSVILTNTTVANWSLKTLTVFTQ